MTRPTGRPGPAHIDMLRNPMGDPLPTSPRREPEATRDQVAAMDSTMHPLEPGRVIRMVDADGRVWKWDGETRR